MDHPDTLTPAEAAAKFHVPIPLEQQTMERRLRRVPSPQGIPVMLADGSSWIIGQIPLDGELSDKLTEALADLADVAEDYDAVMDRRRLAAEAKEKGEPEPAAGWPRASEMVRADIALQRAGFEVAYLALQIHYPQLERNDAAGLLGPGVLTKIARAVRGLGVEADPEGNG